MNKTRIYKRRTNQKQFFDQLAIKLQIQTPSDWGKIKASVLRSKGFPKFNSLHETLQSVYPEIIWKKDWFAPQKGIWNNSTFRRDFFIEFAKKYQINKPSDWQYTNRSQILKHGGSSILGRYGGSILRALKETFPNDVWNPEWFAKEKNFWQDAINRRNFFDNIAKKRNIKEPRQWAQLTVRDIDADGGMYIKKCFRGSLFESLVSIYPEIRWKREWFNLPKFRSSHWENLFNQKNFLLEIATKASVGGVTDWKKVSLCLIKRNGGNGLLQKYHGSLSQALKKLFPEENWGILIETRNNFGAPRSEYLLEDSLKNIFSSLEVKPRCSIFAEDLFSFR